ncbi:30S ribosomal protein S3 [Candidatus Dependentiae bacterium]|nr:30S ribosomal protein S3 [Candidatus Dependentiae bacterium]
MGQKVHPIGFRTGVYRGWQSRWFARSSYGESLLEDVKIRKFLNNALENAEISAIEIEKAGDVVRVVLHSGRPGVVIGKKGQEIETLKSKLAVLLGKNVEVSVQEVKNPELDAMLIAKNIAQQLIKRVSYKRAMKRAAASAMRSGARGIKIRCGGRLMGAEIARKEWLRVGSTPLHTLRSDIDYGFAEAKTTYGIIGVAVWVCRGEFQSSKLYGA